MRSLNIKPTIDELKKYFLKHNKDGIYFNSNWNLNNKLIILISCEFFFVGRIDFAEFLDILHHHLKTEEAGKEILAAFRIYDTRKTGYISTKDLKFLLTMTGEKLSNKDGKLFSLINFQRL